MRGAQRRSNPCRITTMLLTYTVIARSKATKQSLPHYHNVACLHGHCEEQSDEAILAALPQCCLPTRSLRGATRRSNPCRITTMLLTYTVIARSKATKQSLPYYHNVACLHGHCEEQSDEAILAALPQCCLPTRSLRGAKRRSNPCRITTMLLTYTVIARSKATKQSLPHYHNVACLHGHCEEQSDEAILAVLPQCCLPTRSLRGAKRRSNPCRITTMLLAYTVIARSKATKQSLPHYHNVACLHGHCEEQSDEAILAALPQCCLPTRSLRGAKRRSNPCRITTMLLTYTVIARSKATKQSLSPVTNVSFF